MIMKNEPKKVFVGMSGGVDSSVSAALLKKANYDVTGVFIRVWDPAEAGQAQSNCTWRDERREAMRVAAVLDIPFKTIDLSKEYKKEVVDYMVREYRSGRTPNPDVMCNKHIKFGAFYKWAMKQGADFVATGHYATIAAQSVPLMHGQRGKSNARADCFALINSADEEKDQTYFLWNLKTAQLPHILFPVGGMTKTEVRKLAKKFDLPNAEKKDSQGLCFVGQFDFKKFLKQMIKPKRGVVLNEQGEEIGCHDGATLYTIGERRGFTITKKTPNDKPYFVIAKDAKKNTLTVSTNPAKAIGNKEGREVKIEKTNWIGLEPKIGDKYQARIRYRQPLQNCKIKAANDKSATIIFDKKQTTITPGQSLVLYQAKGGQKICLGGGVIK